MDVVIVFSSNLKLDSLLDSGLAEKTEAARFVFVTSHHLYENERHALKSVFGACEYLDFGQLLSDFECENIDLSAYDVENTDIEKYFIEICHKKNQAIAKHMKEMYPGAKGYVFSDDLGVCMAEWESVGFSAQKGRYYYSPSVKTDEPDVSENIASMRQTEVTFLDINNITYVFIGKISRFQSFIDHDFSNASTCLMRPVDIEYISDASHQYLVGIHNASILPWPYENQTNIHLVADAFVPINYTSRDLLFKPYTRRIYVTNNLQRDAFQKAYSLETEVLPLVKRIYMPQICVKTAVKRVLVSLNCSGPWTALMNQADTDRLIELTVALARHFTDIHFVIRPHPLADSPTHEGIYAIERIRDSIETIGPDNLTLSVNVSKKDEQRKYVSVKAGTLQEELEQADLVLSECSNSLLEAGYLGIPFASINITNRRNFYQAITDLGFPHCESIQEVIDFINCYTNRETQRQYADAVDRYNRKIY